VHVKQQQPAAAASAMTKGSKDQAAETQQLLPQE
jgi:hypothetical protein